MRNIFAFTAPNADFREYISVNYPMSGQPEGIVVTVRSAGAPRGNGYSGEMTLDRKQARELGLSPRHWMLASTR
jgi:hypothetical protein